MHRAYLSIAASEVPQKSCHELYGLLAARLPFAVEPRQRAAWESQIKHLKSIARDIPNAHFFLEFLIPRMGRRADLIIISGGVVFVVEYKVGSSQFERTSLNQVFGYGLDLKNFHEPSRLLPIVPILIPTTATKSENSQPIWHPDGLADPLKIQIDALSSVVQRIADANNRLLINPISWFKGRYRPTPTIVEAAQALYRGHEVEEISRSEAGAENLTRTSNYIEQAIELAKNKKQKIICFVTGVPGAGKTLAGLNVATSRQRAHEDEHAVFLSGNGPLVAVLREALIHDAVSRAKENNILISKSAEKRKADAFIQNIHHFRDEGLTNVHPPFEKVAIFDEAQRAWNAQQTDKFMREKHGTVDISKSEPEFLIGLMDRHDDWCAIICLVGNGQEINTGEAGIEEWLNALQRSFREWYVHVPSTLMHRCQIAQKVIAPELHLATSIRSFRAEKLSDFVGHVISNDTEAARKTRNQIVEYPLLVTRDLDEARAWLRERKRGNEHMGLLASSNGLRLKPYGIFVKARIEPEKWFLSPSDDVRSSDALEDAATEFDVQGLELDWACLCWDANFCRGPDGWQTRRFQGSRWNEIRNSDRGRYLENSYRVLMTRARQGLIIFVPRGRSDDPVTEPKTYNEVYEFLLLCGFDRLI